MSKSNHNMSTDVSELSILPHNTSSEAPSRLNSHPTVQSKNLHNLPEIHPKGEDATVLLTSVFGPYAVDDEYGSRKINPMELYHNQVTREQGPFSLRMFHRSWGQMLIQANITSPCTNLDFPTLDRFVEELKNHRYDIIGIGSIIPNIGKVRKMCELIRQYQPQAVICVGGHISNIGDLEKRIDCDFIVRGDGVRWYRMYLNQNPDKPLRHPVINSGVGTRACGVDSPGEAAATIIPSVGCPMGCNFCATSAMYGGKGHFVNFYETGDELYCVMNEVAEKMGCRSFFMMDENFLLHRPRAMRVLELMKQNNKSWAMYVFSSINALTKYSFQELNELGVSWVWIGLEGEHSQYNKLNNVDVKVYVREMQNHGIRILGSSIIGMEEHTPENIQKVIDYAVDYKTDFHQFMLYTPNPGTPLFKEMTAKGKMKKESVEYDLADTHGQYAFNFNHPHIKKGEETEFLRRAFQTDFEVNGPSLMRLTRTLLNGWLRYKNDPDERVRSRWEWEMKPVASTYIPLVAAMKSYYRFRNRHVYELANELLSDLQKEFGFSTKILSFVGGLYLRYKIWREERRLDAGWTYEPPTFYQRNQYVEDNPIELADAVEPLLDASHRIAERRTVQLSDDLEKVGA